MNTTIYKPKGTTDIQTNCDCCGKENLKSVVVMAQVDECGNETGNISYFGRVCASKHAGISAKELWKLAKRADKEKVSEESKRKLKEMYAKSDKISAWIKEKAGTQDYSKALKILGGTVKALKMARKA